jgi:hypothetical protein
VVFDELVDKMLTVSMCRDPFRLLGFSVIAITVCESSYRYEGQRWGKPNSRMMIRTYRSSFPTSLEAYHSHSDVLRDTAEIHSSVVVAIN